MKIQTARWNMSLKNLPDDQLIESYKQAIELNLDLDFIEILRKEIERRNSEKKSKRYLFS